jgi:hypothetical protein
MSSKAPFDPPPASPATAGGKGPFDPPTAPPGWEPPAPPGAPVGPHDPVPGPGGGPGEPMSAPAGGPHDPGPGAVGGRRDPMTMLPAPGEQTNPHLAEPVPARAPVSPGGSPNEPAPVAAHPSQSVPVAASSPHGPTPHFGSGRQSELPSPHGGGTPHGPGDGGPPIGGTHGKPHDGGPHGHGHGGSPGGHASGSPSDHGPSGPGRGDPPGGGRQDPVHSHEPSGDGWHRLPDQPTDPHYGEPLSDHWDFADNPADPNLSNKDVAKLIEDPKAPFGRDPQGHAYTEQQYAERFNKVGDNGAHWHNFPLNDGALPGTRVAYTEPAAYLRDYGSLLDRVGKDGKFLAVMESGQPASWEERALHVDSLRDPYNAYTFGDLPEGWTIEVSEVAPGLGQPGGSTQVRIIDDEGEVRRVAELVRMGVLR